MMDLIQKLNNATEAYDRGEPYMSDREWDDLYFQLEKMEDEAGFTLPNSPTQKVVFEKVSELKKVEHNHLMLSLAKTKSVEEVESFLGDKPFIAMPKMDGLTCSLRYVGGRLVSAETRGNGQVGEDILHNIFTLKSVPKTIPEEEELIVDGEIICKYNDFEDFKDDYKNPRNFAAGSIRLLDASECAKRKLTFVAWDVIKGIDWRVGFLTNKLDQLEKYGFETVFWIQENPKYAINDIKGMAEEYYYPIDGVVFKFNDIEYGKTLGSTEHHFKNAIAYKFYDETYETTLRDIEWSMGRTGILTPIAIFDPVDIDGSTVERASLHNLAIMEQTLHSSRGWQGQRIEVYKANQIIPQIYDAEVDDERTKYYFSHPVICPICKGVVKRVGDNYVCSNPDCEGKLINRLDHFCGKKGLDIKGLSKATLEKLIEWDWVNNFSDIYHLADHKTEWIGKPGFGPKSVSNVLDAIEASREVELASFISAIGVPQVGLAIAKKLVMAAPSYEDFREKVDSKYDFSVLDGFADSKTQAILSFNYTAADEVYKEMKIINAPKEEVKDNKLAGITVCITGRLKAFTNRGALVEIITSHEGKVVDRMSQTVEVLINNDIASESAKNKYAKEHGIPILTEEEFKEKYLDF